MRLRKIMHVLAAAVVATTASLAVAVQPASAATYWHGPMFSHLSLVNGNGVERAMAILNASTGNTAPMVHAPFTPEAPHNDIMWLEQEAGDWVRIKPQSTFSSADNNVHNDKCLAIKNNDLVRFQPVVNATCSYDSVNNDVWKMTSSTYTGTGLVYQFRSALNQGWCITVDKPTSNGALFVDLCRVTASNWKR
jgi:hypothetical protein